MFPGQIGSTKYETLEDSLKDATKSINVDKVIGFKAGNPITHSVHIKGCNLGQAMPFVTKLKEALGGNVKLTVPKLFHGATPSQGGRVRVHRIPVLPQAHEKVPQSQGRDR